MMVGVFIFKMEKKQIKNIFILSIIVIAIFGYLDAMQIIPWQQSGLWETYNSYVAPAILGMWTVALLCIAITHYIIRRDKSEAVGIFISAKIMMAGGLQDLFFFLLTPNIMPKQMCWFKGPQTIISKLLGEACVSPIALTISSILAVFLAYNVLKWFFKQKW